MTHALTTWLRCHTPELAITLALATPTLLSPWLALLPAAWMAWWGGHEYRHRHRDPTPPPATTHHTTTDRSEASA